MIRIMLEKKDYYMKIRSFDTEFYCGSFFIFLIFLMSFFKVKILDETGATPISFFLLWKDAEAKAVTCYGVLLSSFGDALAC